MQTTPEEAQRRYSAALTGGPLTRLLDKFVETLAPTRAVARLDARSKVHFIREAARGDRFRKAPDPLKGPESPRNQRDTVLIMQRARELTENSGFFESIAAKFADYCVGNLRFIPRTGNPKADGATKEWLADWETNSDATGRFHFTDQLQMLVRAAIVDGDHGIADVFDPDTGTYQIQSIEADRIGHPYTVRMDETNIRGVHIDAGGSPTDYDIYRRSLADHYTLEATIPAATFHHYFRGKRPGQYRGISAFESVCGLYEDVRTVREAEIMALKWASSKAGVVKLLNPPLPGSGGNGGLDRGRLLQDPSSPLERISPGEVGYLRPGEDITVVEHNRPNPNLMAFLESLLHEAALGTNLPYAFVFQLTGLTGTPTRLAAQLATRTFRGWQFHLERHLLNRINRRAILSGIYQGHLPYTEYWWRGMWMFPAHPSVDIGRESAANLAENRQGLKTAATIYAEQNEDWFEGQEQIAAEAEHIIELAQGVAARRGVDLSIALNLIQQT